MDKLEIKVRMYEAAARAYGGPSSLHLPPEGIVKTATDWYNDILKVETPDTVQPSGTLKLPKKPPPT